MSDGSTYLCGVLTISDRCARGEATDTAGPALVQLLKDAVDADVHDPRVVPDDMERIQMTLTEWARAISPPQLILTAGGTGLSSRDVTPEATAAVLERRHHGLLELARMRCYEKTPLTYLSRGEAGVIGRTLIINLPGSRRGATQMLEGLLDVLPHALSTLQDENPHDENR